MINFKIVAVIVVLFFLQVEKTTAQQEIDLAGSWGFETDVMDFRRSGEIGRAHV